PMLSPTTCLCRPLEFGDDGALDCFLEGLAAFGSFFGASACVGAVASAFVGAAVSVLVEGLRLKEMSFLRKSRLTVRLLRLGGRGGPRGGVHRYEGRRRCARAATQTLRAGS